MASESLTAPTLSDDIVAIMGVIEAIRATIAEATYTLPIVDIRKVRWPSEPSFPVFKMTYDARAAIKVIDRTLPPRTAIPAYIGLTGYDVEIIHSLFKDYIDVKSSAWIRTHVRPKRDQVMFKPDPDTVHQPRMHAIMAINLQSAGWWIVDLSHVQFGFPETFTPYKEYYDKFVDKPANEKDEDDYLVREGDVALCEHILSGLDELSREESVKLLSETDWLGYEDYYIIRGRVEEVVERWWADTSPGEVDEAGLKRLQAAINAAIEEARGIFGG